MKNQRLILLLSIPVIVALACNLPSAQPVAPPEAPPAGNADIAATQTSLVLTQAAMQNPNPPAPGQPESTATETPTVTPTPTITSTGTPTIPMVSVSVDTNCRSGPGVVYNYLTGLLVGEKAEVVGKYTATSPAYWIIKKGSVTCWLWGQYATVEGDVSKLTEMIPPPSPTPTFTATPTIPVGDLSIIEIFMSTGFDIVVRVRTEPSGSLSGSFQYRVFSNGTKVSQGNCPVPTGSNACSTGYIITGTEVIRVVIDANNAIPESDESNNSLTVTCDKFGFTCN